MDTNWRLFTDIPADLNEDIEMFKGKASSAQDPIRTVKGIFMVLIVAGMVLSLIGCGAGGSSTSSNSGTTAGKTLKSLAVGATGSSIPVDGTQQFTATGSYSDGSSEDLTSQATWASSSTAIATIGSGGLATGVASGTTTISATVAGVKGSQNLTVTPILTSITLSPGNPATTVNASLQFSAFGTWSDGSEQDLTNQVAWSSSNSAVASVDGTGLASTKAPGTVTISANQGTVTGSTTLTVNAATLTSIVLTPDQASVALGISQPFTATGVFSDGSTQQLASATWTSSDPGIVSIDNAGLGTTLMMGSVTISATSGSITGATTFTVLPAALVSITLSPSNPSLALGTSTQITATGLFTDGSTQILSVNWLSSDPTIATVDSNGVINTVALGSVTITATSGSISASISATVTPAQISSIAITPLNASVALDAQQQFAATGTFSDGSVQDITNTVTWTSSDGDIATINSVGLATTLAVGSSTITASMGTVTGSATLQVTTAALQSITVSPSSLSMATGTTAQLTATGSYSDGSTQDLTSSATWLSSSGGVASVSSSGFVTARKAGSTTITATFNGISGSSTVTVADRVLQSIVVTPANPSVSAGQKFQFTATGYYADGSSQDLTVSAHWSTSSANIATINSGQNGGGLATTKATGVVTITASLNSVAGSTTLTVQ